MWDKQALMDFSHFATIRSISAKYLNASDLVTRPLSERSPAVPCRVVARFIMEDKIMKEMLAVACPKKIEPIQILGDPLLIVVRFSTRSEALSH
jgi:hypothetical protein